MAFFDLSVPYLESDAATAKENSSRKAARLKVAVMAMELGYSGIAYDRGIRGVMSDKDRCPITAFPLTSLLKVAPILSASVDFHRGLLAVPPSVPFRQYTRLTLSADSVAHVTVLNSGNPVLRTYDLIAVRPLSQAAFDQACTVAEVDLIAIDFTRKLPFRMKLPMVKAAIERGVCFEFTYSNFISNIQSRRQMLSDAKLLVDWTRGKNLIFSSAATSADEIRGPYDVANLSSLFGLSTERAKAAVSKNCRVLLDRALKKKQFYKEAIRIENISPTESLNSLEKLCGSWSNWDPISDGDCDFQLIENFAKYFPNAVEVPKNTSKELNTNLIKNALNDPAPLILESVVPSDYAVTSTLGMPSCSNSNNALGCGNVDENDFAIDDNNPDDATPFSSHTAFPPATISRSLDESAHVSEQKPDSTNSYLMPTPQIVEFSNIGTEHLGSSEISLPTGDSCSSEAMVQEVDTTDNVEPEKQKNPERAFSTPVEADESFDHHMHIEHVTAQEVLLPPMIATIEETTAATNNRYFSLGSCTTQRHKSFSNDPGNSEANLCLEMEPHNLSLLEGECLENVITDEERDGGQQDTDAMFTGGGSSELKMQGGFLSVPQVNMPSKECWTVKQGRGHLLLSKAPSRPKKPGTKRFMLKLQRQGLHIPSRGLFKPLLFRGKNHLKGRDHKNFFEA